MGTGSLAGLELLPALRRCLPVLCGVLLCVAAVDGPTETAFAGPSDPSAAVRDLVMTVHGTGAREGCPGGPMTLWYRKPFHFRVEGKWWEDFDWIPYVGVMDEKESLGYLPLSRQADGSCGSPLATSYSAVGPALLVAAAPELLTAGDIRCDPPQDRVWDGKHYRVVTVRRRGEHDGAASEIWRHAERDSLARVVSRRSGRPERVTEVDVQAETQVAPGIFLPARVRWRSRRTVEIPGRPGSVSTRTTVLEFSYRCNVGVSDEQFISPLPPGAAALHHPPPPLADLERRIAADPRDFEARILLASIRQRTHPEQAWALLRETLEKEPRCVSAYELLPSFRWTIKGWHQQANALYTAASAAFPEEGYWLLLLATTAPGLREKVHLYEQALRRSDLRGLNAPRYQLAEFYLQAGERRRAAALLREILPRMIPGSGDDQEVKDLLARAEG